MANDINKTIIVGRLTRDTELKQTNSGIYFCKFSIASNRTIFKKDSDNIEQVGYYDIMAQGKTAETISKYMTKGSRILIDGYLNWSSWENSEGKKQSKVEIIVEKFQFLDSKKQDDAPF